VGERDQQISAAAERAGCGNGADVVTAIIVELCDEGLEVAPSVVQEEQHQDPGDEVSRHRRRNLGDGTLADPITLREFTSRVADTLPATAWGIRAAGDPDSTVRTVAVCGGSGDSMLDAVTRAGADVYVTSDLRHHVADEHLRAGGPALIDVAHWAGEFPWCAQAQSLLDERFGSAAGWRTTVATTRTDPWTIGAGAEARKHPSGA
jgi:putative NIF3 family GTP cyclohydrolase 1 type 2